MAEADDARELLEKLKGRWAGRARLWFEPDALECDDVAEGVIEPVGRGRWVRHEYTTQISGDTHAGSALIGLVKATSIWEQAWADSFHTSGTGIMLSRGPWSGEESISVLGSYPAGEGEPDWGWRTTYEPVSDALTLRHFNITPSGEEALAVQFDYERA